MQQKILIRNKTVKPIEIFSPRTTASNIWKNDYKLLTRIILKLTKPTILKLKAQFRSKQDQVNFITFAKIMGRQLVGWEPNIPNRRYQMIRCLYILFNQIDYTNKQILSWEEVINFTAQRPITIANEKSPKNSLKSFTRIQFQKPKFQNSLQKVVYMNNIDKLAVIQENSNIVKFIDPSTGQLWNKYITISPKKIVVSISSLRKTNGQYKKKQLQLTSSVRILDILYISEKYQILLTSSSDRFVRAWKYTNNFSLSTDFTDEQFLFEKEFPQDISSLSWDPVNQILFCGSIKGKLFFYNIQLDLKNQMKVEDKQGHNQMINTMIVVPKLHFIVSGGMDGKVLLWDVQTYRLKQVYKQHTRSVACLAYHPDLILVFSAGYDTNICVWNPYTSNLIYKIVGHSTGISTMAVLTNTNFLISISEGMMKITELNKFKTIQSIPLDIDQQTELKPVHMTIIPNRLRICVVGKSLEMFDYDKTYNPSICDDGITLSCRFSENKLQFYTISGNKIKVWSALTGNIQSIHEHDTQISCFEIDKYEKCFIVGDFKGFLSLYNMSNGYKISTLLKTQSHSPFYYVNSIVSDNDWIVAAVNQQNNIFFLRQADNNLVHFKTIKVSPTTNVKSITHLKQHKLICVTTDSQGILMYQFDNLLKIDYCNLLEIVSLQQILKNIIQISFSNGEVCFYYSPPSNMISKIYSYQHDNQTPVVYSLYNSGKNYICDERWSVSCYDYKNLLAVIQNERYQFSGTEVECLWNIKVSIQSVKDMILVPEWQLFVICSEDREVKLWNMETGNYIDSLKQNYNKAERIIFMKQPRKTILELQNKYQEYDPYFHSGSNKVSNKQWNLFINFKDRFKQQHSLYYKLMKQLNICIAEESQKQNDYEAKKLIRFQETKNRSMNLLMKSFHQDSRNQERNQRQSIKETQQIRQVARSTLVRSLNKPTNLGSLFPGVMNRCRQSFDAFRSFHQERQFPSQMHRYQKQAFRINFQKRLSPFQKMVHKQNIDRLSTTFLQGKKEKGEPPKMFLHKQEAIAARRLNNAFCSTYSQMHKPLKLFKNIIQRRSGNEELKRTKSPLTKLSV